MCWQHGLSLSPAQGRGAWALQDAANPNSHSRSPWMLVLDVGNPRDSEEQRIRWLRVLRKFVFVVDELCLPLQDTPWASLHLEIFHKLPQKGFQDALCDPPHCRAELCGQGAPIPGLLQLPGPSPWLRSRASSSGS